MAGVQAQKALQGPAHQQQQQQQQQQQRQQQRVSGPWHT
jgi:hypothetical protein